jgi:hypothetical protein
MNVVPWGEVPEYLPNLTTEGMDDLPELPTMAAFTLFEPQDLVSAARRLTDDEGVDFDDYDLEGVMSDFGGRLIALACRIKREREKGAAK